jgi:hypothetical protein
MKIAVLGWGSLIWDRGCLRIIGSSYKQPTEAWRSDGPKLPVEFARISEDKRLTLVVLTADEEKELGAKRVPVLWAIMETNDMVVAIKELYCREGMYSSEKIGYYEVKDGNPVVWPKGANIEGSIKDWASRKEINAVIWTGLESQFEKKTGNKLTGSNVIDYLKGLSNCEEMKAGVYVRRTPAQIQTKFRYIIEKELGWVPEE